MKGHWDTSTFLRANRKEQQKQLLWWFQIYFYLTNKLPKQGYLGVIMDNLEKERWGQETRVVAAVPMAALAAEGA